MPENNYIEKKFTYDIADQYLYQTKKLKRKAEWTYKGPDKLWIFIDNTTNKIISRFHYTERDEGADVPTPEGQTKVLVNASINPDIASLIHNEWDYGSLPHTTEELPNNTFYGHPDPIPPDHTYELTEIVWNPDKKTFVKPYPWKQPHVSWDDIINQRNGMLSWSDSQLLTAQESEKPKWEEFRKQLRDLPTVYKDIDPWKIPMPQIPGAPDHIVTVGNTASGV